VDDADQAAKYNKVSLAAACILLIAFCFINLIYYMQTASKLDQLAFDLKTITAGDFTVELDITRDMFETFKQEEYDNQPDIASKFTRGLALKRFLMRKISSLLSGTLNDKLDKDPEYFERKKSVKRPEGGFQKIER